MTAPLDITVVGLAITSSWGNGHATTYRALAGALARRGHRVTFLERDTPWYAAHRDDPHPAGCRTILYGSVEELADAHRAAWRDADVAILGSYVPDGVAVAELLLAQRRGPTAFYDIDTPVTLAALEAGECAYLAAHQVPRFDLYLSFTGGPMLRRLERRHGARRARALYCSVDPERYAPVDVPRRWALGYLGTYSPDRQPGLERLLLAPARARPDLRFVVGGPQYPDRGTWPGNVESIDHVAPPAHPGFYAAQRATLNLTRAHMVDAGWSPSVRLFEAAACGTPLLSDPWQGLDRFFAPGREIVVVRSTREVLEALGRPDHAWRGFGERARARVLAAHTADHRAVELETAIAGLGGARAPRPRTAPRVVRRAVGGTLAPRRAAQRS